jgi:hypothetical protein
MAQVEAIQQVSSSANRLMLKLTKKRPDNEGKVLCNPLSSGRTGA